MYKITDLWLKFFSDYLIFLKNFLLQTLIFLCIKASFENI